MRKLLFKSLVQAPSTEPAPTADKRSNYGTTITMQGARLATFCDTLPSNSPASRPRPRLPTAIASTCSRWAASIMASAASPHFTSAEISNAPTHSARFLASLRTRLEMESSAAPTSFSAPASCLISSPERFPPTVRMESLLPVAFAIAAATSTARFAPFGPVRRYHDVAQFLRPRLAF